tara:strand:+ start:2184 stop:2672 length:489 start_codon:yes stop_codon:yes gene_type:complete
MVKAIRIGFLLPTKNIKKITIKYLRKKQMCLIDSIKQHEGFVAIVYKDSLGIDTIGYGFAIKDLELDEDICGLILERKLENLICRVDNKFSWYKYMPQEIKDVVVEMCYQLGVTGFSKFRRTISYLQNKQWEDASIEMLDSLWARQTPNRAEELSYKVREVH